MCRSTKNFQQLMYRKLTESFDADIIIVGAGLSGMSAAYYILERVPSLTVVILEASCAHLIFSSRLFYFSTFCSSYWWKNCFVPSQNCQTE